MKKYMIVEKFKTELLEESFAIFEKTGRMLPEGLYFLNSWLNEEKSTCFQLMETNNPDLFSEWLDNWSKYGDFEIHPIS